MGHIHQLDVLRNQVKKNLDSNHVPYSSFFHRIFVDRAPQGAQLGVVNGTVVVVYPGSDAFNAANTNFNLTLVRVTSDVTTNV